MSESRILVVDADDARTERLATLLDFMDFTPRIVVDAADLDLTKARATDWVAVIAGDVGDAAAWGAFARWLSEQPLHPPERLQHPDRLRIRHALELRCHLSRRAHLLEQVLDLLQSLARRGCHTPIQQGPTDIRTPRSGDISNLCRSSRIRPLWRTKGPPFACRKLPSKGTGRGNSRPVNEAECHMAAHDQKDVLIRRARSAPRTTAARA